MAFDRITFEPEKMGPHLHWGLRTTAGLVVSLLADGVSLQEILDDYRDLESEDIRQSLNYAAWLTREEVVLV